MNEFATSKVVAKPFGEALQLVQDRLKEVKRTTAKVRRRLASRAHLAQCGFGVISTIDFQAAFRDKIGKETLRSVSLGACNPGLAWKVYQTDEMLAVLLPCHVLVQEQKDGGTKVTMVEPSRMFSAFVLSKHPELEEVAADASTRLHKAMDLIA